MVPFLFVLLIAVPLVELYVIVQVAHAIGILETILLLVLESMLGAWLLKRQGLATWRNLRQTLARGEIPTQHLADGAMILLGGALLLTPGFVTDLFGFLLLVPVVRSFLRRVLRAWAARRARRATAATEPRSRVYAATATRVRSRPSSQDAQRNHAPTLKPPVDDSRDKG
jgi:UPF0716 protein FxsA